jgi:arylformamidase
MPIPYQLLCFMIEYQVKIQSGEKLYFADLSKGVEVALPLKDGSLNPNCYYAEPPEFKVIVAGDFKGSVAMGGPVNHRRISLSPHGNGTHTEGYGHISADPEAVVSKLFGPINVLCRLVSVRPEPTGAGQVISSLPQIVYQEKAEALAIRTLPNTESKKIKNYSGTNPAYFDDELLRDLGKSGILHLLTDLPSLDPEIDGGRLAAHKAFFGWPEPFKPYRSVTELCFFPNELPDGLYFLQLQLLAIELDASPSRPILFPLVKSFNS